MKALIACFTVLLLVGSCVDISDEIVLHQDGSGTYKYVVNFSASKVKINSILALDSLDGYRVPSLDEIKEKIERYKLKLESKEGISNVNVDANYDFFVFKINCDFTSVTALQDAIREIVQEEVKDKAHPLLTENWLSWDGKELVRSIPNFQSPISKLKAEDQDALKKGKYTAISRFDKPVEKCENPSAIISPSKLAVMIASSTYSIGQNPTLLKNTITVSGN